MFSFFQTSFRSGGASASTILLCLVWGKLKSAVTKSHKRIAISLSVPDISSPNLFAKLFNFSGSLILNGVFP